MLVSGIARWTVGLGLVALFAAAFGPMHDLVRELFDDPFANDGAAVFSFFNERPDDIWILGLRLGDTVRLAHRDPSDAYLVSSASRRGNAEVALVTAHAGDQQAEVRYRIGADGEHGVFRFPVTVVAQHQCDVAVRFTDEGPRALACANHRPASYGGSARH